MPSGRVIAAFELALREEKKPASLPDERLEVILEDILERLDGHEERLNHLEQEPVPVSEPPPKPQPTQWQCRATDVK